MVLIGIAAVMLIGATALATTALFKGQDTANKANDTARRLNRIVHQATCGGGHKAANLAACHRLCPNLSTISNLRCNKPREVVAGHGNSNSPSGLPSPPRGGLKTPQAPERRPAASPAPSRPAPILDVPKTLCDATSAVNVPVCL